MWKVLEKLSWWKIMIFVPFRKCVILLLEKNVSLIHMRSLGPMSHLTETFICGHPLLLRMSNCWEILKTEFSHLQGVWVLCVRKQRLSGHRESRSHVCSEGRCAQWWVAGRRKRKRGRHVKSSEAKVIADAFSLYRCWILERFAEPYPLLCNIS